MYSNDGRNPHFALRMKCSDGVDEQVEFSKEGLARLFEQVEKIQDELNTYM